jgi:RNA polymerase sigma factor (sigma-70 family)
MSIHLDVTPPAGEDDARSVPALVEAARAGDEQAWSALHVRFTPLLRAITRRHRLCEADAADVAQNTWTRCLESLGRLREPAALPGWLATTCQREAQTLLRRRGATIPVDMGDTADPVARALSATATSQQADPLTIALRSELHACLRALVDELEGSEGTVMRALLDDSTYRAVSAHAGVPQGSIGPTRQRAIARLRRRFAESGFGEERLSAA